MSEFMLDARKACKICSDKAKLARRDPPAIVLDHSMGDCICTGCGLVLESSCIDTSEEWRSFAPEGVSSGMAESEMKRRADHGKLMDFASDNVLGTQISGTNSAAQGLQKAQWSAARSAESAAKRTQAPEVQQSARQDQKVKALVGKVRDQASRLSLGQSIIRRCHAMLEDLESKGKLPPRMPISAINALIHLASSQERATRTTAELAEANAKAAGKREGDFEKQIQKKVRQLSDDLEIPLPTIYVQDEELMARFVSRLELTKEVCKPASHIARQAHALGLVGNKVQVPVVACAILIVAWLLDVAQKPGFAHVGVVAKVSESSVKATYRGILPHIRRLLPEDFRCRLPSGIGGLPPPK